MEWNREWRSEAKFEMELEALIIKYKDTCKWEYMVAQLEQVKHMIVRVSLGY